jgi:phage-related protein
VDKNKGDTLYSSAIIYRAVYTVKIVEVVYVLHCFQKKSKQGIKTAKQEIDLIKQRLQEVKLLGENKR